VLRSSTHKRVSAAYNAWAVHLKNDDLRFAGTLNRLAEGPMHELPDRFKVIATRELQPGELIDRDATTIFPSGDR
jgi:hypothetical protein